MQVPGSVSRLLKQYQSWAGKKPDFFHHASPRSRLKFLPLLIPCLVVPTFHQGPQYLYFQVTSVPRPGLLPPVLPQAQVKPQGLMCTQAVKKTPLV
jgi:hypothetical protein